jgi:hypothetical protein
MLQNYIYIHYTAQEKLIRIYWNFDFFSICKLLAVEVRQRWKPSREPFLIYTFSHYSSIQKISCF